MVLVCGAALTWGCAGMYPPEVNGFSDDDLRRCASPPRTVAIAACERVLARPDVGRWPGGISYAATAYWARANSAWHLARYLAAEGRNEESLAASLRSIELFERYDRERRQKSSSEFLFTPGRQTAMFQAYLARAEYAAGLQLVRLRRWSDAMPHLQRVVELDNRHAVAWATLGVAANEAGDYAISTRAFERTLELEPGYFTELRSTQRSVFDASRDGRRFELGGTRPAAKEP
jgi:tetratricopeptide (TPR) repeat protein